MDGSEKEMGIVHGQVHVTCFSSPNVCVISVAIFMVGIGGNGGIVAHDVLRILWLRFTQLHSCRGFCSSFARYASIRLLQHAEFVRLVYGCPVTCVGSVAISDFVTVAGIFVASTDLGTLPADTFNTVADLVTFTVANLGSKFVAEP